MAAGPDEFGTYCERMAAGFWAEPANALTNAAFAVAALAVAHGLRSRGIGRDSWDLWLLAGLIGCIAVGSFLWHTLAQPWAAAADVVPILLFVSVYLVSFLLRVAGLRVGPALGLLLAFEAANFGLSALLPGALNGSIGYLPTWLGLAGLAVYARWTGTAASGWLVAAFGVFTVSLLMRSIDAWICPAWPVGTHLFWHLLNALVLYLSVGALIRARLGGRGTTISPMP